MLYHLLACLCASAAAFQAPLAARPVVAQRGDASMQISKKVITFDQDGVFEGRETVITKPPLQLLARIEELRVLSAVADAGLLSLAEENGVFSSLENAGAFSKIEKLLPLADDLKLLSTLEGLLNVPANLLVIAAGAAALTLAGTAFFFSLLQGEV